MIARTIRAVVAGAAALAMASTAAASYRGARVAIADAPWMASIVPLDAHFKPARHPRAYALRCSAAVIGPRRVLTAAHCVREFDMAHQGVRVGADDLLGNGGRVVPVRRAWSPQAGNRKLIGDGADLAVIETTKPLGVPALPLAGERARVGEKVSSFGFGDDRAAFDVRGDLRPFLRRLDSTVAPDCFDAAPAHDVRLICTTTSDESGTRHGDSGGPLVILRGGSPALAGVTSAGGAESNIYADAFASRSFIARPPQSARVPMVVRPIRIAGDLRPGGRATCSATLSPKPTRLTYRWNFGPLRKRSHLGLYYDAQGQRRQYADNLAPDAEGRMIALPRNAGGKRVQCIVTAYNGPIFQVVTVAVLPRLPRGR